MKLGLALNHEFFGLNMIPLVGAYWRSSSGKHTLNVMLPIVINYRFMISKAIAIGSNISATIDSYRLSEKKQNSYIEYSNTTNAIFLEFSSKQNLYFQIAAGFTAMRRIEEYPDERKYKIVIDGLGFGAVKNPMNEKIENGAFIEMKAGFRIFE